MGGSLCSGVASCFPKSWNERGWERTREGGAERLFLSCVNGNEWREWHGVSETLTFAAECGDGRSSGGGARQNQPAHRARARRATRPSLLLLLLFFFSCVIRVDMHELPDAVD